MTKLLGLVLILLSLTAPIWAQHIPFEQGRHGEILLHVKVNDDTAVLLLDTGASWSVINPRLGGNLATMSAANIIEAHTLQTVHIARGTLNFGSGDFDTAFVVTDLNPAQSAALGIDHLDGVLGMHDLCAFKSLKIDFRHKVLELER